jgi:photosystem II stability/assembly factor-like uncharacterized protein
MALISLPFHELHRVHALARFCEPRDETRLSAHVICRQQRYTLLFDLGKGRMTLRGFLCSVLNFAMLPAAFGQSPSTPFDILWTSGSCRDCQIVRHLGGIGVITPEVALSVGYLWPTEGEGNGDYSVVRSNDAGKHWVEIAGSRMHANRPFISFVDSKTGWISGMSIDGSSWVLRTDDAGSHWRMLSEHFIQSMQFINSGVGVGSEFNGSISGFVKTSDGGRTWTRSAVPDLKSIWKVFFLTPEVGWVAGTNELSNHPDRSVGFVLRTTDGGRTWKSCRIPLDTDVADIRDLFFLDDSEGWLITWHFNKEGTHLFHSTDGGRTWRLHPDQTIQGRGKWLSVVRFLDSRVGFAFNRDEQVSDVVPPPAIGVVALPEAGPTDSGRLLYTSDGGEHWQSHQLGAWVYDCKVLGPELGCTASRQTPGFWLLRIRMKP